MEIIPTINCKNFECIKRKLEISRKFKTGWIQLDISDGKFSQFQTWNDPELFSKEINYKDLNYYIEVHLMVIKPREFIEKWLEAGVNRIIINIETDFDLDYILNICQRYGSELMLSISPDTPIENIFPYLEKVNLIQVLSVPPGPSGQSFQDNIFLKINALLEKDPGVTIEVDGGIDDKIAKELKKKGVDIIALGSFIFDNPNPEKRYKMLKRSINSKL